jgi:hypothetical protein
VAKVIGDRSILGRLITSTQVKQTHSCSLLIVHAIRREATRLDDYLRKPSM